MSPLDDCDGHFAGVAAGNAVALPRLAHTAPIGSEASTFSAQHQRGATVDLSDFLGAGVILDFCRLWCAVCQTFYSAVYPVAPGKDLILPMVLEKRVRCREGAEHRAGMVVVVRCAAAGQPSPPWRAWNSLLLLVIG
ncbi:redoxin domain-containing protein [Futiania mangrovi]|uniref:redoxin domain-containing protein n=1 Tax=Futiania mangrovi TaxID=2959716 RepID=UPI0038B29EE7